MVETGRIKGLKGAELKAEIEKTLQLTSLEKVRNNTPLHLSGGMIRKLSLGMALIGGSDVLILDDWGLIKLNAENRRDLLEVLEDRHGNRSTVATSQLPIEEWHGVIGDPTLADAILEMRDGHLVRRQRLSDAPTTP